MKTKYFINDYFQKSEKLLFPLIAENHQDGLLSTYLFADEIEEDIVDYYLLCEMEKDVVLNENLQKHLYTSYETEEGKELHVFNLENIKEEVDKFLAGAYSQYKEESKDKILMYHDWKYRGKVVKFEDVEKIFPNTKAGYHYYVFLYPNKFKKNVIDDIDNNEPGLWDNRNDTIRFINSMSELCSIYNLEKETFTKKIKS